jgi:chromatin remodeling complex protein RSC6
MSDHQEMEKSTITDDIAVTQNTSQTIETIIKQWEESIKNLKTFATQLRMVKKEIITLEKENDKQKKSKKNKQKKNENKKPSGFAIPKEISNELADFLQVGRGVPISRTEVTKLLTNYIKDNDLKDPDFKRNILLTGEAGEKLASILSPVVDDNGNKVVLSYFNLQKYIKHHFPGSSTANNTKTTTTTTTTSTTTSIPVTTTANTKIDTITTDVNTTDGGTKKTVVIKKVLKRPIGVDS